MTKVELRCHPRFVGDEEWADFMTLLRSEKPSQEMIDRIVHSKVRRVTREQAMKIVGTPINGQPVMALNSHCEDVLSYNVAALSNAVSPDCIVDVPILHNADGHPDMAAWTNKPKFHTLPRIAIGARICLTSNLAVDKGGLDFFLFLYA